MDFIITVKNKRKAQKRRIRKEEKWKGLRRFMWICFFISVFMFVIIFLEISILIKLLLIFVGAAALIIAAIAYGLLINMTSHWIYDRMNEKLKIRNGILYHTVQTNTGLGLNYGTTDLRAYAFAYTIDAMRNIKYDDKSGRIVFQANGTGFHYSDIRRQIIDSQWELRDYEAVFYDYYEPSLFETLKNYGLPIEITTMNDYDALENKV